MYISTGKKADELDESVSDFQIWILMSVALENRVKPEVISFTSTLD